MTNEPIEDFVEPTYLIELVGHDKNGTPIIRPHLTESNKKKVQGILKEMGF